MKHKFPAYNPRLKFLARKLRKNMTLSEILLWEELKQRKLCGYKFSRQKPINKYIVDFYCNELKLIIEVDGESHDFGEVSENDQIKDQRLKSLGYTLIRIDDLEVKQDINAVTHDLKWHIKALNKGNY